MIASCAYERLRAGTAATRKTLDAAGAARESLRGRTILTEPRDLALHVVSQIPCPSRDPRPSIPFQQNASFRLEILTENWRTTGQSRTFLSLVISMEERSIVTAVYTFHRGVTRNSVLEPVRRNFTIRVHRCCRANCHSENERTTLEEICKWKLLLGERATVIS